MGPARFIAQSEQAGQCDEPTIVARAQDGDLGAFEQLVDAYQGKIFRLALRMLNNRSDAEDMAQETLIAAWRRLPQMATPGSFGPWVYRVATNRCLDVLRQRKAHRVVPMEDQDIEDRSQYRDSDLRRTPVDPSQQAETSAQMNDLTKLLRTVTPEQRACWLLREMHGRSYAEIAEILQISEPSVRGRIARARVQLAEGMDPWR